MSGDDRSYFLGRFEVERDRARSATLDVVAAAHRRMAETYLLLIASAEGRSQSDGS